MSLTCIQTASTSIGGIPGRLVTFQAWRQVATIWIFEECHIQRKRKRQHRDVRESVVSECVLFLKGQTDGKEQENQEKDCAHKSQREKECVPTKKSIHVGSIDSPWCIHEVGEKGLRNPPRTRLNHQQALSRYPRSPKSTLEFPSLNLPTRDSSR